MASVCLLRQLMCFRWLLSILPQAQSAQRRGGLQQPDQATAASNEKEYAVMVKFAVAQDMPTRRAALNILQKAVLRECI